MRGCKRHVIAFSSEQHLVVENERNYHDALIRNAYQADRLTVVVIATLRPPPRDWKKSA